MSTLSQTLWDILAGSAPRMRELVGCEQRWRRRRDGAVVVVRQVHRTERMVEVSYELAVDVLGLAATRWPLTFDQLRCDFEVLVSAGDAR